MSTLSKHAGPALVAILFVALALIEGGFDAKALAVVTLLVWWVVVIGVVIRAWPGSRPPRAAVVCGGALAALAALTALSILWADDAGRAFEEVVRVGGFLGIFVLVVLASRRGSARSWAAGLAAGLGAVAALALLARFQPGLLTDGPGDLGAEIPSAAGRLSYPIGYWNGLGAVMALAVVALLWQAASGRSREGRALAAAAVPLPILALHFSQSLGGTLAAVVGVAALLVAARPRGPLVAALVPAAVGGGALVALSESQGGDAMLAFTVLAGAALGAAWYLLDERVRDLARFTLSVPRPVAIGAVLLACVAALVALGPGGAWEDFKDPGTLDEAPVAGEPTPQAAGAASAAGNGRYQWWAEGVDAWLGAPITGIGAGNYELYWNEHSTLPVVVNDAHSLYVETLAELGPLGLAALLAFLGAALYAGIGRRRQGRDVALWLALLTTGAVSAAGEWTWEIPAATAPVVLAAAILTGPATLRPRWPRAVAAARNGDEERELPERSGFGLGVATMLAGFVCIWVAGVSLLSTVQLDESRDAVDAGDLDEAAKNATYAAAIQPWSAAAELQVAQVEELRGRLAEAREAAEEGVASAPTDWRAWVVLARILARDGERAEAEAALERANELSPLPIPGPLPEPAE